MTTERSPYYVTTPIYYVNDRPHIGHCYTTLVADVAARLARLIGRDVFFLTGTDEHAEKVSKTAAERGHTPLEWADINAERFKQAFAQMNFSNDDFVRTTEDRHKAKATEYIQRLVDSGDIELGDYSGWYDPSQEEYLTENVAKEANFLSPVTGQPLEQRTEQNYFFRLDKYEAWLREQIESDTVRVLPKARKNEVMGRIKQGLNKVPVSRKIKEGDADWGIAMPGDPEHRIYVWIEALCNYLTVMDTPDRRQWWPKDAPLAVHLMAKDILWFHAVIWPCMLHALGEQSPKTVYAHAYFISEGRKMSKSLGNFIEIDLLEAYADRYSLDAVRWFLATQGPMGANDADFAYSRFVEVFNSDLANGIGNATSRVGNMIAKYFGGSVPDPKGSDTLVPGEYDWPLIIKATVDQALEYFDDLALDQAAKLGIDLASKVDGYINVTEPFRLAKKLDEDPANTDKLAAILYHCAEALRVATLLLAPAMPEKMAELWRTWSCNVLTDPADANSPFVAPLAELAQWNGPHSLKPGQQVTKGAVLFMRADASEPAPEAAPVS
ncbi:MAG: methionyl-tRNA synthetase [Phycisphaerales bacterium]|jgi:methionyl-tRNA synthetase